MLTDQFESKFLKSLVPAGPALQVHATGRAGGQGGGQAGRAEQVSLRALVDLRWRLAHFQAPAALQFCLQF